MIDVKQKHLVFSLLLNKNWTDHDIMLRCESAQEENKEP